MIALQKSFLLFAVFFALLAVAAGAFGAHFLRGRLQIGELDIYETAVRYQMYHALALMGIAWACGVFSDTLVVLAGWIIIAGVILFSGSLYALVFTGIRSLGIITPIGGTVLLIGWLSFFIGVMKS